MALITRRLLAAVLATASLTALTALPALAQDKFIVMSSTTSTEQSGLFKHLLPQFTQASGIAVVKEDRVRRVLLEHGDDPEARPPRGGEEVAGRDDARDQARGRMRPERREDHRDRKKEDLATPADPSGRDGGRDQERGASVVTDRR